MWQFSIFIGNRCKRKTTDIWRCTNEEQCVPDKTGWFCRTTTRGVRLARQGCWCCACQSSSPVLQESYCRIPSMGRIQNAVVTCKLVRNCIMEIHCKTWDLHNFTHYFFAILRIYHCFVSSFVSSLEAKSVFPELTTRDSWHYHWSQLNCCVITHPCPLNYWITDPPIWS